MTSAPPAVRERPLASPGLDQEWAVLDCAETVDSGVGDETENWLRAETAGLVGATALANTIRVQDLQAEGRIQTEFIQGLGSVPIGGMVERSNSNSTDRDKITGLRSSLEHATAGQAESLASNINASQTEALTSVGVMPDIHLTRGPDGRLQQGGQDLYSVVRNTIEQHPGDHHGLHKITQTEGLNYHALDVLDKTGFFDKGYVWVVPRMVPKNTPSSSIRTYGYFENLAVSWSFIWKAGPDQFVLRPMFTAGVNPEADEEITGRKMTDEELDHMYDKRLQRRHDIFAVSGVYQDLGLPVPNTIEEFARGFLRHKDSFEESGHPEAEIGSRYDSQLGPRYYQGLKNARGDYVADGQKRAEALRQLRESTPDIIKELVAHRHELDTDMAVAYRMAELVRKHAVDYVIDHPEFVSILGPSLGLAALKALKAGPDLAKGDGGEWRGMIHDMARAQTCGFGLLMAMLGGSDEKGPLAFTCSNGHINMRQYGGGLKPECDFCSVSVMC